MSLALTENISAKLQHIQPDALLSRQVSVQRVIEVLSREHNAYPVVVGEFGSGRTTMLYQLASKLSDIQIRRLDVDDFELRTQDQFENQLQRVFQALKKPTQTTFLFLDELESLWLRKPAAWPTCVRVLLQTIDQQIPFGLICNTPLYYEKLSPLPKFNMKIEAIFMQKYNADDLLTLLTYHIKQYRHYDTFAYDDGFLPLLIEIAQQHINTEAPPASVFNLLDKLIAQAKTQTPANELLHLENHLTSILAGSYGIHLGKTGNKDLKKIGALAEHLEEDVFGQQIALLKLQQLILNQSLQITASHANPLLFVGKQSVGKRTCAQALHHFLHGQHHPLLTLDLSKITLPLLRQQLTEHLRLYPTSSLVFLNAQRAPMEILLFLQQSIEQGYLRDQYQKHISLTSLLVIFICEQSIDADNESLLSETVVEQQEEILQLVVTDLPGMQPALLTKPAALDRTETLLANTDASLAHFPESLLKNLQIIAFQTLSFSAKEKLVEKYLLKLSKRIMLKYALSLNYHASFIRHVLLKLDLSQACAHELHQKLDECLSQALSICLLNKQPNTKNLVLQFSHQNEIVCFEQA